jgi:hypothetical protein
MHNSFTNPYIFPIFFISMWLGITLLLAYASGWKKLAQTYSYQNEIISQKKNFQWVNLQGVDYRHCVTIGGNDKGLYLSLFFLFSFGSPSLFIPWGQIKITKKKYFWFPVLEMNVGETRIMILQSLETFLREISAGALPV